MRSLRKNGVNQWRDASRRRLRLTEPKVRRQASDPKSALMLLGEQVANAVTK